jgi:hypothetical protein
MRTWPNKRRRGFVIMIVVVFLVVIMAMIGETFRQIGTTLRIEAARSQRVACDEGSMEATAWALSYIQDPSQMVIENEPYAHGAYQVVFTKEEPPMNGTPDPDGSQRWMIQVTPTQN